jgi:catechol 2,3-dioxygenase-like lactoylglutathione lyase family enzyme
MAAARAVTVIGLRIKGGRPMASMRYLVKDLEAAIAFYVGSLGFELKQQYGPAMAILSHGDLTLWLAGPPASASKPMPNGDQPVPGGWNRFVLEVADIDALVSDLKAKGIRFRNEVLAGPGGRQILCEDPSGNPIELFQAG